MRACVVSREFGPGVSNLGRPGKFSQLVAARLPRMEMIGGVCDGFAPFSFASRWSQMRPMRRFCYAPLVAI